MPPRKKLAKLAEEEESSSEQTMIRVMRQAGFLDNDISCNFFILGKHIFLYIFHSSLFIYIWHFPYMFPQ